MFSQFDSREDCETNIADDANYEVLKSKLLSHWKECHLEIIAIVEGADPITGGPLQARHSYITTKNEGETEPEILWGKTFSACVFHDSEDGTAVIDFSKFHDTC